MDVPAFLIEMFPPDRDALLHAMCDEVTDEMLVSISKADYGQDSDKHLKHLLAIKESRALPERMGWEPREVIELWRHTRPGAASFIGNPANTYIPWDPSTPESLRAGHVAAAFCCAVLLTHTVDHPEYHIGAPATHRAAIRSCSFLGSQHLDLLARLLSHLVLHQDKDWDDGFLGSWGLAIIALRICGDDIDDTKAHELIAWLKESTFTDVFDVADLHDLQELVSHLPLLEDVRAERTKDLIATLTEMVAFKN